MKAIYWREGKPEYAKLGLNIYTGCSHDCKYCYNKYRFHGSWIQPRNAANLNNINNDLMELYRSGDKTQFTFVSLVIPTMWAELTTVMCAMYSSYSDYTTILL
jgi:DNA repair photolyase